MPNKLKKFCKISRYIEQIDEELSQMITDLCLDRLFIPRGVNGITFLYPKDPAYRKEILASAYSDNPEKAIQMLESLIILDYLPRPGDFVLKKDDIPNSLKQRIEVTSADASSVHLTCGAVLKPDTGFSPISSRENMAVYTLTGKQIPLDGPKATMKYASKRRTPGSNQGSKKTGGSEGGYYGGGNNSNTLHKMFIKQAIEEIRKKGTTNRFSEVCLSYLQTLFHGEGTRQKLVDLFTEGRISQNPIATYLTALDPLNQQVDKIHFQKWEGMAKNIGYMPIVKTDDLYKDYQNMYEEIKKLANEENKDILVTLDEIRETTQDKISSIPIPKNRVAPSHQAYKDMWQATKGSGDYINSFLRHHEMTFLTHILLFQTLSEDNGGKLEIMQNILDIYERLYKASNENDLQILNGNLYKGGRIDPAGTLTSLKEFTESDCWGGGARTNEGRGSTELEYIENPAGRSEKYINLGQATKDLYVGKGGIKIGGLQDLIATMGSK